MRRVMVVACVLATLTVRNASASVTVVPNLAIFAGRVTACQVGRTLEAGATLAGACVGERGRTGSGCAVCGASSFKAVVGSAACGSCGSNMRSLPGSASRDECLCRDGFTAAVLGAGRVLVVPTSRMSAMRRASRAPRTRHTPWHIPSGTTWPRACAMRASRAPRTWGAASSAVLGSTRRGWGMCGASSTPPTPSRWRAAR